MNANRMVTMADFSTSSSSYQCDNEGATSSDGISFDADSSCNNPTEQAKRDETDELVSKENRAVMCLRLVVMFILLAAGAAAAAAIYISISSLEEKAFEDAVDSVSQNLLRSFQSDLRLKFFTAQAVSAAISGAIEGGSKMTTVVPQFELLVQSQRILDKSRAVYWSPYLETSQERDQFEAFASSTVSSEPSRAFPPCHFCGSLEYELSNKKALVEALGGQTFQCGAIEDAALAGVISPERCEAGKETVSATCGCERTTVDLENLKPVDRTLADGIFSMAGTRAVNDTSSPPYHPIWQISGSEEAVKSVLYNQQTDSRRAQALKFLIESKLPVLSQTYIPEEPFDSAYGRRSKEPGCIIYFPVFDKNGREGEVIGSLAQEFEWQDFVTSVYPPGSEHLDIVIWNSCQQSFTFRVENLQTTSGRSALVLKANEDVHDAAYTDKGTFRTFDDYDNDRFFATTGTVTFDPRLDDPCRYGFSVYPTADMESMHRTSTPVILAIAAVATLSFAGFMFLMYDRIVTVRQRKIMRSARRTNAIVSSLFPANVRNRLFDADDVENADMVEPSASPKGRSVSATRDETDPIADLFPATTVMFLDIAGFTAWSSEREPSQVFKLLEALYGKFDEVARRMGVFKVETIGDSYVAVVGLPDPRPQHAVVMARFASVCMKKFNATVQSLEVQLGPSTAELRGRCGLHSGPVTAGVLRGDKARFQLFGDTMNVASRMESTGVVDKIQVSEETAKLLRKGGKSSWIKVRTDQVVAKGLGRLTTYFLTGSPSLGRKNSNTSVVESVMLTSSSDESDVDAALQADDTPFWDSVPRTKKLTRSELAKSMRLVDWNVEILYKLLANIAIHRTARKTVHGDPSRVSISEAVDTKPATRGLPVDQITEVIDMPDFDPIVAAKVLEAGSKVGLGPKIREELRDFVVRVASMYRDNPFHSFDHASHVTMSATKLLRRVVSPTTATRESQSATVQRMEKLHHSTYGISSDPVIQFTVVLATLIHDLDHTGLSNQELMRMQTSAASKYGRSVAEQNSLDVAWWLLTETSDFANLCGAIFSTREEKRRFRQILVNAVLATDIADKELQLQRKERWTRAFSPQESHSPSRKATIVMDYIMQASDVSHTMQHFLTYRKWNSRLFAERYRAWKVGHDENPIEGWYEGEIGFFDFYIIPLAMKLKECGVFGVSHDEYLNYALANRDEWQKRGKDIVQELIRDLEQVEAPDKLPCSSYSA